MKESGFSAATASVRIREAIPSSARVPSVSAFETESREHSPVKIPVTRGGKSAEKSRFWIVMSLGISSLILAWSFSVALRGDQGLGINQPADGEKEVAAAEALDPAELARRRITEAERYRQEALAMDREFMAAISQRRSLASTGPAPGREQAIEHYERRAERIRAEIESLEDAQPGSLAWQHRERLKANLEDSPR